MKCMLRLVLVLVSIVSAGWAQQTAAAENSASKADVLKLFEVMHLRDQMKLVMNQVSGQMKAMSHDQLRKQNPQIADEEIAKLDAQSDELLKAMPIDGMLDDMIPVYQKHLSRSDVDGMMSFYSSPTGQKILKEMPAMTAEGMQAIQPRLRKVKVMDETMAKIQKMTKESKETHHSNSTPAK
jgi:uncharacterized protein